MAQFLWKPGSRPPKHDRLVIVAFKREQDQTVPFGDYFVKFAKYANKQWSSIKVPHMWSNIPELPEPIVPEPRDPSIPIPKPPSLEPR